MKEIIETSKGKFVVCDKTYNSFLGLICKHEPIKLSEITEEEASNIVDDSFNSYNEHSYKIYTEEIFSGSYIVTAIESLQSLLKHHNIKITNNTYIFKV